MKCVVTGGSGFIGSHVVARLRRNGHEVVNVDLNGTAAKAVDICDTAELSKMFEQLKPDAVFHIAAIADARYALAHPVKTVTINIGGTASVLEASRNNGVKRVILASTCWVSGAMDFGTVDEKNPFLPEGGGHPYTSTKIASELLCHDYNRLYGLPFTILRYGIPYGPRMWPGLVLRDFMNNAFSGKPLTIFGDGTATRNFVFVEDLAEAHALALQPAGENQTYNLEGMRPVTVKELAQLVSKLCGGAEIQWKEEPTRKGEFKRGDRVISNNKAWVELKWRPTVDLEEGVKRSIEWFKAEREAGRI
jgi:UDP-glucose 4-epimerase